MHSVYICFAFIGVLVQTSFVCDAFLLETNLGKFIQNSEPKDIDSNRRGDDNKDAYRKLNKNELVSAFKGFLQIVDDPLLIKRSTMGYNIADVVRSEGFVENLGVYNLRNATLDHVFISENDSYAELRVTFPSLTIVGWYNMTFHLDRHNISIYGNGSFSIQLNNLAIVTNITLAKTEQAFTVVNKIAWNQTLSGVAVKINNLLDDEEVSSVFSENLSVVLPALHNSYKSTIDDFMSQAAMIYGKMLFFNSKHANLESIVAAFAKQTTTSTGHRISTSNSRGNVKKI